MLPVCCFPMQNSQHLHHQHYDDSQFQCIVQLKLPVDNQLPSFNSSDVLYTTPLLREQSTKCGLTALLDLIVPRGIENKVAISMVCDRVHRTLDEKSRQHQLELRRLGQTSEDATMSSNVAILEPTNQVRGINTILMDPGLEREDFVFYFDRIAVMLVEQAFASGMCYKQHVVKTPVSGQVYHGLAMDGEISAAVVLRGGTCLETGLKRVVPDCRVGRLLIQTNFRTGEPELHYYKLNPDVQDHKRVLLLDPQMSSGGAALMAVRVLLDHGVKESHIVFVTYMAGRDGLNRLMSVYPDIKVVLGRIVDDSETRWVEERYLGC